MAAPDLSNIPAEDLQHIANGDMGKVSDPVIHYLAGVTSDPVDMKPATGLAGPLGSAIKTAAAPLDLLATGATSLASSAMTPVLGLAARAKALLTGQDPDAASDAAHRFMASHAYQAQTPAGQAAQADAGAVGRAVAAPFGAVANTVENAAGPAATKGIESASGTVNDIAGSLPVLGAGADAARSAATAAKPLVARGAADVAQEAGYTGLSTRADMNTPGSRGITNQLVSQDIGVVPGADLNVAAVQNGRNVGPGKIYQQVHDSLPTTLTQDNTLAHDLGTLQDGSSQLPKSPDVAALRQAMVAQPSMTSDELFANIREARERASTLQDSDDPDKVALGRAYTGIANAYESFAGRQMPVQSGVTLPQWQAARTQMAQSYLAEQALKGGTNFDPAVFARAAQNNPNLLSGGSKIVADTYNALDSGTGSTTGRAVGAVLGAGAGAAAEHMAGSGIGMGAGGGAIVGSQVSPAVQNTIRKMFTRGNLDAAQAAPSNPRLSYHYGPDNAPRAAPPGDLTPPPGQAGPTPTQGSLGDLLQGPAPAPGLDLAPPPGEAAGAPAQRQMSLPPGKGPTPANVAADLKAGKHPTRPAAPARPQLGDLFP